MAKMKSIVASSLVLAAVAAMSFSEVGAALTAQGAMTKQNDGTYVVNTTSLAQNVRGFRGATPLRVYIKKDKIVKVEALPNKETPQYFGNVVHSLLDKWNGMSVSKAAKTDIDGVTGATYSSNAVKENVKLAAKYYKKNKKK